MPVNQGAQDACAPGSNKKLGGATIPGKLTREPFWVGIHKKEGVETDHNKEAANHNKKAWEEGEPYRKPTKSGNRHQERREKNCRIQGGKQAFGDLGEGMGYQCGKIASEEIITQKNRSMEDTPAYTEGDGIQARPAKLQDLQGIRYYSKGVTRQLWNAHAERNMKKHRHLSYGKPHALHSKVRSQIQEKGFWRRQ